MKYAIWGILIIAAAFAAHRVALWAEQRGWIHYVHTKGSSGGVANAFLEVQSLVEPSVRHVQTEKLRDHAEADESGDPPHAPMKGGPK